MTRGGGRYPEPGERRRIWNNKDSGLVVVSGDGSKLGTTLVCFCLSPRGLETRARE